MTAQTYTRSRPPSEIGRKVEALLKRYPHVSDQELATLLEIFPQLPILDHALMTSDDRLASKLEAFHRDHGRKLKTRWSSLLVFLAIPAIVTGFVLWWIARALLAL